MKKVVWDVVFHCDDCAEKFEDFVRAFPGVKDVKAEYAPKDKDRCDFKGRLCFTLDEHRVLEKTIRSEARAEGFEVL
jgi:copper chaperone CopZ